MMARGRFGQGVRPRIRDTGHVRYCIDRHGRTRHDPNACRESAADGLLRGADAIKRAATKGSATTPPVTAQAKSYLFFLGAATERVKVLLHQTEPPF